MDPAAALERLTEVSSDVRSVVIFDGRGVLASTFEDAKRARAFAAAAAELLEAAAEVRPSADVGVEHVQATLADGAVYVLRSDKRTVAAVVDRAAGSTLTLYDLKSCLGESGARKAAAR